MQSHRRLEMLQQRLWLRLHSEQSLQCCCCTSVCSVGRSGVLQGLGMRAQNVLSGSCDAGGLLLPAVSRGF